MTNIAYYFKTSKRMKKNIFEHIEVFGQVGTFYDTNTDKFVLYPNIIKTYDKIAYNRQILLDLGIIQARNNKGLTAKKKTLKQLLANEILFNAGAASGYYFSIKDMDNFNNLNFPSKSFPKKRPEVVLQTADAVIKILTDNIADLTGTGVTLETIAKITDARDQFKDVMNIPVITKKSKANVTKEIARVDKKTFEIIRKELNNEMLVFMVSDSKLYNDYIKVIKITNEGTHKHHAPKVITAPVSVSAIHDVTGDPVEGVTGKFVGLRTTFITDAEGKFTAKVPLGAGLCKLVAVDFNGNSFAFTLTVEGYSIIIRMIPTGV